MRYRDDKQFTIETHAKSLKKWAGFSLYFMLYFY